MHAEVPILRQLGYEVFVPKVLPRGVRSAATTFEYDADLTIPAHVLAALNEMDFYRGVVDEQVAAWLNEYFGGAFIFALQGLHRNVLRYFRGAIVFRAFGAPAPDNYSRQLQTWDPDCIELVRAAQDRFWFASGYPHLSEAEPPLLANRNVYLPIGIPQPFIDANADTWRGDSRQILLFCADILTQRSNTASYYAFKKAYGDLPHVIVGGQTEPIDDPHVVGFLPDDEVLELMRSSAVMVYPSRELRHVQYHPIEASVVGLPVVFQVDSLLGTFLDIKPYGAVSDDVEGRALVERLLEGDQEAILAVRRDEHLIAERFTERWCEGIWAANLDQSGIGAALSAPLSADLRDFDASAMDHLVPQELLADPIAPGSSTSLRSGIDFSNANISTEISATYGLSFPESWGRRVLGRTLVLKLAKPITGNVELELTGGTHEANFGLPIPVEFGGMVKNARLESWISVPGKSRVWFAVTEPADVVRVTVPHVMLEPDGGQLGFSILRLRIRPRPTLPVRQRDELLADHRVRPGDRATAGPADLQDLGRGRRRRAPAVRHRR